MSGSCLFCAIAAGAAPARVVYRDEATVAFMDINPFTRGHALVIPRAHHRDWFGAPPEVLAAVARAGAIVGAAAQEGLAADGVHLLSNVGAAAWQSILHLHLHVIPQYAAEPVRLPFRTRSVPPDELDVAQGAIRAAIR